MYPKGKKSSSSSWWHSGHSLTSVEKKGERNDMMIIKLAFSLSSFPLFILLDSIVPTLRIVSISSVFQIARLVVYHQAGMGY